MLPVFDDEIERLKAAVGCRLTEIHHLDSVSLNKMDKVSFGEIIGWFVEKSYERVRVEREVLVHGLGYSIKSKAGKSKNFL